MENCSEWSDSKNIKIDGIVKGSMTLTSLLARFGERQQPGHGTTPGRAHQAAYSIVIAPFPFHTSQGCEPRLWASTFFIKGSIVIPRPLSIKLPVSGRMTAEELRSQVGLDDVGITKATTRAKVVCDNGRPLNQRECDVGLRSKSDKVGTRQSPRAVENHLISSVSDR